MLKGNQIIRLLQEVSIRLLWYLKIKAILEKNLPIRFNILDPGKEIMIFLLLFVQEVFLLLYLTKIYNNNKALRYQSSLK